MLTIPTGNLVGALTDTTPFASNEKELPAINAVRFEWDGEQLHLLATDRYVVAISTWDKDDETWGVEVVEDDLFTELGGADEPWAINIALDDAKELISDYKLAPKLGRVPLTVDYDHERCRLTVKRGRETGHPAKSTTVEGLDAELEFPDVRQLLANADVPDKVEHISFDAKRLARFGKVRQVGPLRFTFTGESGAALVSIGERFTGAVMPVKPSESDDGPRGA